MLFWIDAAEQSSRIVLIHPDTKNFYSYLSQIVQHDGTLYLRLSAHITTSEHLEVAYQQAMTAQELSSFNTVVLDEVDSIHCGLLLDFLHYKIAENTQIRFVLFGRELLYGMLEDVELSPLIKVMPADLLQQHEAVSSVRYRVRVNALGQGQAILNQIPIMWDGSIPRLLFFFMIDKGMTTRDALFEVFWPQLSIKDATNVFHVTKRKLSELLGFSPLTYQSGFYRLSDEIEVAYDVHEFKGLLQTIEMFPIGTREPRIQRLIALYEGDFLQSDTAPWIVARRQEMRQLYAESLLHLALLREHEGRNQEADTLRLRAHFAE